MVSAQPMPTEQIEPTNGGPRQVRRCQGAQLYGSVSMCAVRKAHCGNISPNLLIPGNLPHQWQKGRLPSLSSVSWMVQLEASRSRKPELGHLRSALQRLQQLYRCGTLKVFSSGFYRVRESIRIKQTTANSVRLEVRASHRRS